MSYATYLRPGFGRASITIAGMEFVAGAVTELAKEPTEADVEKAKAFIDGTVSVRSFSRTLVMPRAEAELRAAPDALELREYAVHGPLEEVLAAVAGPAEEAQPVAEEAAADAAAGPETAPSAKAPKKPSKKKATK